VAPLVESKVVLVKALHPNRVLSSTFEVYGLNTLEAKQHIEAVGNELKSRNGG
jgi:hypothetical protein